MLPKLLICALILTSAFTFLIVFSSNTLASKQSFQEKTSASTKNQSSGLTFSENAKKQKISKARIVFSTPTPQPETKKIRKAEPKIQMNNPTATPTKTPTPTQKINNSTQPTSSLKKNDSSLVLSPTKSEPSKTPQPQSTATNDDIQKHIINAINEYRKSQNLGTVRTDPYTCSFAKLRAKEIVSNFSHEGFRNRIDSKSLPYPDYSQITENIAMTSDHTQVVPMWIASSGHAENMRKDTPFVCVEHEGEHYAYAGWRP